MKTHSTQSRLINGYSVIINRKVASCAVGRAACFAHHPEIVAKVTIPEGAATPVFFWLGCLPLTDTETHPPVALLRDPIERFKSACKYGNLTAAQGIKIMQRKDSSHFQEQNLILVKGTALYLMERDFDEFISLLGLSSTIEQVNPSSGSMALTNEEEELVRDFYAKDIEIYNSVTYAGYAY